MTAMNISSSVQTAAQSLQAEFLALMPSFESYFRYTFRDLSVESRAEAVAEATASAWSGFCQAKAVGKNPSEFPAAIAGFAARRVRSRRPAFGAWTSKDAMSPCAQKRHGFLVVGYDQIRPQDLGHQLRRDNAPHWISDALIDLRRTNVPREVAFRIDFANWLKSLSVRQRAILRELAKESTTGEVAKKFEISPSRVSQYRRELEASWNAFHAGRQRSNRKVCQGRRQASKISRRAKHASELRLVCAD